MTVAGVKAPRFIPLSEADRLLGLPAGVVGAWVSTGLVRSVLFVHRGQIVRGVLVVECRRYVDARRARAVTLASRRNTVEE